VVFGQLHPPPPPPRKESPVPIGQEAGWDPESVWMLRRREKFCTARNHTRAVQPVAQHYTDWAIRLRCLARCTNYEVPHYAILLRPTIMWSLLGPNILTSTLLSNTLSVHYTAQQVANCHLSLHYNAVLSNVFIYWGASDWWLWRRGRRVGQPCYNGIIESALYLSQLTQSENSKRHSNSKSEEATHISLFPINS
jgi:hypothetical protein